MVFYLQPSAPQLADKKIANPHFFLSLCLCCIICRHINVRFAKYIICISRVRKEDCWKYCKMGINTVNIRLGQDSELTRSFLSRNRKKVFFYYPSHRFD
jgi:hypothetical protein